LDSDESQNHLQVGSASRDRRADGMASQEPGARTAEATARQGTKTGRSRKSEKSS